MSKTKTFIFAILLLGLIAGLYAGVNADVSLPRAAAKTLRELEGRVDASAFSAVRAAYEYENVDFTVDYAGVHAAARLLADGEKLAVGGGIFGEKSYGITHGFGAALAAVKAHIAALKPEFTENASTGELTAVCRFNDEKYGEVTAVFTLFRRRITAVTVSAAGLDATLDLGANALDEWTLTVNGETATWRVDREDRYSRDRVTFGGHTVATYWDAPRGHLTLRIDDLETSGSLFVNEGDFRLQLDGADGFTLALSGEKNAAAAAPKPEFTDIGGDYAAFGELVWAALGTLYAENSTAEWRI
jgi:hypothetical protein